MPRSTFGKQPNSRRLTAPAYGFGASTREVSNKVFVSQEHTALAMAGTTSLGPATYTLHPSIGGKQPDGRKRDPPTWKFGTGPARMVGSRDIDLRPEYMFQPSIGPHQRLSRVKSEPVFGFGTGTRDGARKIFLSQQHQKLDMYGMASPGPAAYDHQALVGGKQPIGRFDNQPVYSLASRARPPDKVDDGPGPAEYRQVASVGQSQPNSKIERAATPKFGTSTREQRAKLHITSEHEKGLHGTQSAARWYDLHGSLGRQVSSKSDTRPRTAFARASRFASHDAELKRNSVPGPGAYDP